MLAMYAFSVSGLNYLAHLLLITLCQQYFSPSGTKIGQLHVFLVPQLSAYHCLPLGCSSFRYIVKSLGPQDVLSVLSICSTIAITIVAETYGPFMCIPAILLCVPFHPFVIGLFLETYQQVDQATCSKMEEMLL